MVIGIVNLLVDAPNGMLAKLTSQREDQALRRLIWAFTRNPDMGLPGVSLNGKAQWHPLLLNRVKTLLAQINKDCGLTSVDKLGSKLTTRDLPDGPLLSTADLNGNNYRPRIRVDTVHQAKGERSYSQIWWMAVRRQSCLIDRLPAPHPETGRCSRPAPAC